jgi:hypothetical protein
MLTIVMNILKYLDLKSLNLTHKLLDLRTRCDQNFSDFSAFGRL